MLSADSRDVGIATLGLIVVVLAIFLAITWVLGDSTDHLGEHQPQPSPAESSAPWIDPVRAQPALEP